MSTKTSRTPAVAGAAEPAPATKKTTSNPLELEIKDGTWVFRSWEEFKLILEPVRRDIGRGQQGGAKEIILPTSARDGKTIFVLFQQGGVCRVSPEMAHNKGVDFKTLVELMLHNGQFGRKYRLVSAPGFEPDEGLAGWIKRTENRATMRPQVSQGAKAR